MKLGAGDQVRTDDLILGKDSLYQLSYTRITNIIQNFLYMIKSLVEVEGLEPTIRTV